ncbi:DUF308 domain-containing protein [Arachnia propionica]|uniref:DUF308 domain-containing protein n=1 Tax=Arachnia propionica TaxID=1750 RepID=A0A3P1T6I6_9ACTN|nr:DUF308 domain-containing protein [Arachnia propionica]MDO5083478.1 DUF308 domain-containing protein [Arachnia propionica]RRD04918.1 DUF308 domain-containing protein [Arachnia propionica]
MAENLPKRSPDVLFLLGGAVLIFGIVAMVWPGMTAVTFAIIWGITLIVAGLMARKGDDDGAKTPTAEPAV